MKKKFSVITTCFIILFIHVGFSSAFAKPTLENIQFDTPGPNEDRITFKLNGAHLPTTFAIKGDRPRVIFDFHKVVPTKKIKPTLQAQGTFIKSIRTGIHQGNKPKTRVVLDLKPGMLIDFEQDFDNVTNTLIIRVFAAGMILQPIAAEQHEPEIIQEPKAEQVKTTEEVKEEKKTPVITELESPAVQEQTPPVPEVKAEKTAPIEPPPVAEAEKQAASPAKTAVPQETTKAAESSPNVEESTVIQPLSEIGEPEINTKEEVIPTLYSVKFDDTSHRGEIIAFKVNTFNPPVVFGIEEETPRIVCFFKGTSAGDELGELIESNGRFVKDIKIGTYRNPDNIRVILDLVPGKNYDLQQIFFKDDNLFMIIINTTGEKP